VNEVKTAGTHSFIFDSRDLPSGIYFYRLQTPGYSTMKKMVVTK
jgi:hypothetical protein